MTPIRRTSLLLILALLVTPAFGSSQGSAQTQPDPGLREALIKTLLVTAEALLGRLGEGFDGGS